MTNSLPPEEQDKNVDASTEPKKVSLAEAIRKQLEQKKKEQNNNKANNAKRAGNMTAKSQMTKKVNNQRRRTDGS